MYIRGLSRKKCKTPSRPGYGVARFFFTEYTKTGEIYRIATTLLNGQKYGYQMALWNISTFFHSKALQN
jgi:hypothetical protein